MNAPLPDISEAEWIIMKILWDQSPLTSSEIISKLSGTTNWSPKTIRTLLTRLVKKKAVSYKAKSVYSYYPLISEERCLNNETQSFLDRFHLGAFKPLFVNFLKNEKLSKEDIEELKEILENKKL